MVSPEKMRHIRSFVRREGRMTQSQQRALDQLWPRFGIESGTPIDAETLFGRSAPLHLEIGFGMGHALFELASTHPDEDYIGIEVHRPGVGRLLDEIDKSNIGNIRLCKHDAIEVLKQQLPENSLDTIMLFFPDPWHKKRHHKRRIVQPEFVAMVQRCLKPGGLFHLATDWEEYAEWMMEILSNTEGFSNRAGAEQFAPRPESRPVTKFDKRGLRLGHGVWDLLFEKQ